MSRFVFIRLQQTAEKQGAEHGRENRDEGSEGRLRSDSSTAMKGGLSCAKTTAFPAHLEQLDLDEVAERVVLLVEREPERAFPKRPRPPEVRT